MHMNTSVTILFFVKRSKPTAEGLLPIYVRVTVDGQRIEFSARHNVHPDKWSTEAGKIKGTSEDVRRVNEELDLIRNKVLDHKRSLLLLDKPVNFENMRIKILGLEEKTRMLIPIFRKHNDEMKALIGKDFAYGTWERFNTALNHVIEFLQHKFHVSDLDIRKIDHALIKDYEFYLKTVRSCNHNSAMKYITNLKKIVRVCMANQWIAHNPFAMYQIHIDEVDKPFLFQEELDQLAAKEYRIKRLAQVRDVFVFCCYTGLAYSDVKKLAKEHINLGIDGNRWIFLNRTKTGVPSRIPLLPIPEALLAKYKNAPECAASGCLLPVLSNQKMNSYLKEVGDLAGLTKELTMHVARHTFATTVTLTNDVPIESVSKMLGHKVIKQTEHYAKVVDKKIGRDMDQLRAKFNAQENIDLPPLSISG